MQGGHTLPPVPGGIESEESSAPLPASETSHKVLSCDDVLNQAEQACIDDVYADHGGSGQQVNGSFASVLDEIRQCLAQHQRVMVDLMKQHEQTAVDAVGAAVAHAVGNSQGCPASATAVSAAPPPSAEPAPPPPPPMTSLPPSLRPFAAGDTHDKSKEADTTLPSSKIAWDDGDKPAVTHTASIASTLSVKKPILKMQSTLGKRVTLMRQGVTPEKKLEDADIGSKSIGLGKKKSLQTRIDNILQNNHRRAYSVRTSNAMRMMRMQEQEMETVGEHPVRAKVIKLVHSDQFDMVCVGLILLNSAILGLQIDHTAEFGRESSGLGPFETAERVFLIIFILELILRLIAEGKEFFTGAAKLTHACDAVIVVSGIFEQILMAAGGDSGDNDSMFAALRILRLLRLGRSARLLEFSNDLRALVLGLVYSFKSLLWAVLFLNMLMFIYCVMLIEFTVDYFPGGKYGPEPSNATEGCDDESRRLAEGQVNGDTMPHSGTQEEMQWYFGNLPRGMLTLFRCISGGVDWGDVAETLKHISWPMVIVFSVFIGVCIFAVVNIITCIFIENAKKLALRDQSTLVYEELQERSWLSKSLRAMFMKADSNASGVLEWEEFQECFENPIVQGYFRRLGIDIEAFGVRQLWEIFDFDAANAVDVETFVVGTLHLQGNAKAIDMHRVRMDIEDMQNKLNLILGSIHQLGSPRRKQGSGMRATVME